MSSTEFNVEVPVTCARTGRVSKMAMTVEQAAQWAAEQALRVDIADQVKSFLGGLPPEAPDLAVLYKGKVVVLGRVVTKPGDNGVERLLHELTHSPVFPEVAPGTSRKKREKNGTSPSSSTPASE